MAKSGSKWLRVAKSVNALCMYICLYVLVKIALILVLNYRVYLNFVLINNVSNSNLLVRSNSEFLFTMHYVWVFVLLFFLCMHICITSDACIEVINYRVNVLCTFVHHVSPSGLRAATCVAK